MLHTTLDTMLTAQATIDYEDFVSNDKKNELI